MNSFLRFSVSLTIDDLHRVNLNELIDSHYRMQDLLPASLLLLTTANSLR